MDIAPHFEEDALFQGIIDPDTQAIEERGPEVESGDEENTVEERVGRTGFLNTGEDVLDDPWNRDFQTDHKDGKEERAGKEARIAE